MLLDKGADVNAPGIYGSALQAAAGGGDRQIVWLLLDNGANVNAQGGKYGSALQAARQGVSDEIAQLLLDREAHDID